MWHSPGTRGQGFWGDFRFQSHHSMEDYLTRQVSREKKLRLFKLLILREIFSLRVSFITDRNRLFQTMPTRSWKTGLLLAHMIIQLLHFFSLLKNYFSSTFKMKTINLAVVLYSIHHFFRSKTSVSVNSYSKY
jgi:hypothetical protein